MELTKEEIEKIVSEYLSNDENRDAVMEIAKAQGYIPKDEISRLSENNTSLLAEKKKALAKYENAKKEIDRLRSYATDEDEPLPEDENAFKLKFRELKNEAAEGKAAKEALKALESKYIGSEKKSQISRALLKYKIDPVHYELFENALQTRVQSEIIEGEPNLYIANDGREVSIDDYFKSYVETDAGKTYLVKPVNQGSNSQEINSGTGSAKTITQEQLDQMRPKDRAAYFADGGKIAQKE